VNLDLDGRIAVVTGASRGIGLAITRVLAAEGAYVVAGARRPSDELSALTELVAFLAGDRAANVTGTDVTIDGGLITTL
jgi:NAD(P)-dependent dehydrogenase (short-subunit alcohol dehydrogenase family)